LIHDRWIDKYTEAHTRSLVDLKRQLEEQQPWPPPPEST